MQQTLGHTKTNRKTNRHLQNSSLITVENFGLFDTVIQTDPLLRAINPRKANNAKIPTITTSTMNIPSPAPKS